MRAVTGIEIGTDTCVMVRARRVRGAIQISAVDGLQPSGVLSADVRAGDHPGRVRRQRHFPRRARVVAWRLHGSASLDDAATKVILSPLLEAGFRVEELLTPAEALVELARSRRDVPGRGAAAWLAVNRHGAAIAIVHGGALLFSREIELSPRDARGVRQELLQRYVLVANLASELRHGFDVVRARHGAVVDTIVTCGDLPGLRSLTMPLIEEMDIEVETLDSMDGLQIVPPAAEEIADRASALRLACAAAARGAARVRAPRSWLPVAAAAALLAAIAWGVEELRPPSSLAPPGAPPPRAAATPRTASPDQSRVRRDPTVVAPLVDRSAGRSGEAAGIPAATAGREAAPTEAPAPRPRAADRTGKPPRREPLDDPLPIVNLILHGTDRRLAVLDGRVVAEGEPVGGRILLRVESNAVVLREPSGYEVRVPIRRGGPENR